MGPLSNRWRLRPLPSGTLQQRGLGHPLEGRKSERKDPESEIGGDGDSLLLNAELAAGAVSSILKDSDLKRSGALPVDEALALSLQGVASVSSRTLSYSILF